MLPTLYKQSKNGDRIQIWTIETQDDKYRTIEGLLDGQLTTSEWTYCKPKNIGKTNETTSEDQAKSESISKWNKKLDSGYSLYLNECERPFEPTLAHVFEKHSKKIVWPALISPKLDGVRCTYRNGKLFSRKNKEFVNCPHIIEEINRQNLQNFELDGELYSHNLNFNEIVGLVKKSVNLQDSSILEFHIFDLISNKSPIQRFEELKSIISTDSCLKIVDQQIIKEDQVHALHDDFCVQGYEGAMLKWGDSGYIKGRTDKLLKVKLFQDAECIVLDITPGTGKRANTIGRWIVLQENGQVCKVSPSGEDKFNKEIFDNKEKYIGKVITVKFQGYTPAGIMRFPTFRSFRDYE